MGQDGFPIRLKSFFLFRPVHYERQRSKSSRDRLRLPVARQARIGTGPGRARNSREAGAPTPEWWRLAFRSWKRPANGKPPPRAGSLFMKRVPVPLRHGAGPGPMRKNRMRAWPRVVAGLERETVGQASHLPTQEQAERPRGARFSPKPPPTAGPSGHASGKQAKCQANLERGWGRGCSWPWLGAAPKDWRSPQKQSGCRRGPAARQVRLGLHGAGRWCLGSGSARKLATPLRRTHLPACVFLRAVSRMREGWAPGGSGSQARRSQPGASPSLLCIDPPCLIYPQALPSG